MTPLCAALFAVLTTSDLDVKVVDAAGRPAAGATVLVRSHAPSAPLIRGTTGPDGTWRVKLEDGGDLSAFAGTAIASGT